MGLIRLLIFALAAWLVWKVFQNYQVKQARLRREREKEKALQRERMVKCEYCQVHLPESSAVSHEERWFCTPQHRARFLEGDR